MQWKLATLFRKDPEREQYHKEFAADLDRQLNTWTRIASAIAVFAWLGFALDTDRKLHPEFPELIFFRLGLTVLGLVVFGLSFVPTFREHGALMLKILVSYVMFATAFFTGRIADDPNYVSGLQIVVMIPIAAPVVFRLFLALEFVSAAIFIGSVLYHKPNLSTPAAAYSMNNLLLSYIIALAFTFMLDRIRFSSFLKTKKIELKNAEIEAQIRRIHELKTQQDGDYFLTSQLLYPLSLNEAESSSVEIEFLTEQKKKFHFRKWQSEIGGDISSASTVVLRGRKHVAFINGDAMGKSIQGAGGAIVLGTVFKSFLHRSKNNEASQFLFPEQWLRDCYEELHHVMVSFDGRMLVSAVIGLVDVENGFLYYINAEHPWLVLLRDGVATFIDNELTLRKIGMPENDELLRVRVFQLLNGDQVFVGSDGRDDIAIWQDGLDQPVINTDETLFLRVIEKTGGDLHKIREELARIGEITDDLSLVRIRYDGSTVASHQRDLAVLKKHALGRDYAAAIAELEQLYRQEPRNPAIVYELALAHFRMKNFARAAVFGEEYCDYDPTDLGMIYMVSRALKSCAGSERSLLKRAADYGERLILREPLSLHGLINLADIYRRLGRRDKAEKLLRKAESFAPENRAVKKLRSLLDQPVLA